MASASIEVPRHAGLGREFHKEGPIATSIQRGFEVLFRAVASDAARAGAAFLGDATTSSIGMTTGKMVVRRPPLRVTETGSSRGRSLLFGNVKVCDSLTSWGEPSWRITSSDAAVAGRAGLLYTGTTRIW